MALNLPAKFIFPPAMEYVKGFIHSQKPEERRAAVVALAVLAEGCCDLMTQNLDELLKQVVKEFPHVRFATHSTIPNK